MHASINLHKWRAQKYTHTCKERRPVAYLREGRAPSLCSKHTQKHTDGAVAAKPRVKNILYQCFSDIHCMIDSFAVLKGNYNGV